MSETIQFELVSPEQKLVSAPVRMAVIPGEEGQFGVLPGHSALVASLKPGVVELHSGDNSAPQRIFIAGGFADVTPASCIVLAEQAVPVADLNATAIEQEIANLNEDLGMAKDAADQQRVAKRLSLAKAKLAAVA